jgi:hypothetical protein
MFRKGYRRQLKMTIRKEDEHKKLDILAFPKDHGYIECGSCGGIGISNDSDESVIHDICEDCGGDGVVPDNKKKISLEEIFTVVFDESGFSSGAGVE